MADHSTMRLGKKPARIDSRTLKLANYTTSLIPIPPEELDYTRGITNWGMMLNDSLGDCTCAAAGHFEQVVSVNNGVEYSIPDSEILAAYEAVGGYVPGDRSTDNGAVELDVLNYWRKTGIGGKKILAYADVDAGDVQRVKQAIMLFGACYIGVGLPITAQSQDVWDVVHTSLLNRFKSMLQKDNPSDPWSWGGHAMITPAYNRIGPIGITWGALKQMTWEFWKKYCDEVHAVILPDWIGSDNLSASGFDLDTLLSDLQQIGG